jgi:hypothetical protein
MKKERMYGLASLVLVMIILSVACSSSQPSSGAPTIVKSTQEPVARLSPKAANAATAIAESGETSWSMVLLGDSLVTIGSSSLAEQYAELVKQDLGVEIEIKDIGADGLTCKSFLPSLLKYSFNREPLQAADIILISLGGGDLLLAGDDYFRRDCGGTMGDECLDTALAEFQVCWEEFLQEVTTLADPSDTLIRLIISGTFYEQFDDQEEKYATYLEFQDAFYTYQIQSCKTYGVTFLDLYHSEFPEGFIMGDNIHVNQEGK